MCDLLALGIRRQHRNHPLPAVLAFFYVDTCDLPAQPDLTPARFHQAGNPFPQLARPVFGIKKLLDERSFRVLLADIG